MEIKSDERQIEKQRQKERTETRTFKGNWDESWFIGNSSSEVRDGKLLKRAYRLTIRNRKRTAHEDLRRVV